MKVKCINNRYNDYLTIDKMYEVVLDYDFVACITNDKGDKIALIDMWRDFEIVGQNKNNQKTLRDEFAMAAMTGDWAAQDDEGLGYFSNAHSTQESLQSCAKLYYRMADAMLKVRGEND